MSGGRGYDISLDRKRDCTAGNTHTPANIYHLTPFPYIQTFTRSGPIAEQLCTAELTVSSGNQPPTTVHSTFPSVSSNTQRKEGTKKNAADT